MIIHFETGETRCWFCRGPIIGDGIGYLGDSTIELHPDCAVELARRLVGDARACTSLLLVAERSE
jgi:hypothetical protein